MSPARDDKVSEALAFARFLTGIPRFVRRRMTVPQALGIIQDRLRNRERNFLRVVEGSVFANPGSPYGKLLAMAGYSFEDLRALVTREGLEGGLAQLRRTGVYVSFEEFKGIQPIVRGSVTIHTTPADFDNPRAERYYSSS